MAKRYWRKFKDKVARGEMTVDEVIDFDIAEIKTTLKLHEAKKDKNECVIELNGKYYNAEYFINVVDGLGGNVKLYQNSNKMEVDICTSENGLAVLFPMRKPKIYNRVKLQNYKEN